MVPLRIGIAGLGFGGGVHLPVFTSLPGVEVCAILGRSPEKARAAAAKFGVKAACVTLSQFLDRELDAVVVSLPPRPAGEVAEAALSRGLAVLAEKPIAADAAGAAKLAAQAARRTTMVDFEFRELPTFQALHSLIASGKLGRIDRVRISWRALSFAHRNRIWSWKTDAAMGGGVLTLSGLHLFNLLEWIFGAITPEWTSRSDDATREFAPPGATVAADTADLCLRTVDGLPIEAHLSNAAADRQGHRWEIEAENGCVILDDGGIGTFSRFSLALKTANGRQILAADPVRDGDYRIGPVSALAQRFIAAVREGCTLIPAFDEGARAQTMLEHVLAAA